MSATVRKSSDLEGRGEYNGFQAEQESKAYGLETYGAAVGSDVDANSSKGAQFNFYCYGCLVGS